MSDEMRCSGCDRVLLVHDDQGGTGKIASSNMPIAALWGICPDCGQSFMYPNSGICLSDLAIEQVAYTLRGIAENGGYGRLVIDFAKHKAIRVGFGESLRDVRPSSPR